MKKILCIILTIALVFSFATTAMAASVSPQPAFAGDATTLTYTNTDKITTNKAGAMTAVTFNGPGVVALSATATGAISTSSYIGLYTDAAASNGSYVSISSSNLSATRNIVVNAGTYYFGGYSGSYSSTSPYTVTANVKMAFYPSTVGTVANGGTYALGSTSSGSTNLFKFTAAKTGTLKISGSNLSGYVTLLNSSKGAVSDELWLSTESDYVYQRVATFGVKKGVTYYIQLKSNAYAGKIYTMSISQYGVTDKSGVKMSKALKMNRSKTYKGMAIAGKKTVDWYKFTNTKKKAVAIYLGGKVSDNVKIQLFNSKGKAFSGYGRLWRLSTSTLKFLPTNGTYSSKTLLKGTYYIKITTDSKLDSGYYSLKWK